MTKEELKARTNRFAHRVLDLRDAFPRSSSGRIIENQLGRCGTSVGANYRACCKSRSRAEFLAKIGVVEEEADESAFWLEMVSERKLLPPTRVSGLLQEASELTAIMAASRRTASRSKIGNRQSAIGNSR